MAIYIKSRDVYEEWGFREGIKIKMRSGDTNRVGIYIEREYKIYKEKKHILSDDINKIEIYMKK